ncbi:hypothetical protein [Paenalcaligenes suwonensis]|uniref:hypothetical protein n=1 Tax=Paenalcaligenes suwonensis TaxID=1202713 RepID=UPI001409EBEE|nr:hypothetical protein [Paenalcaligenes suwonensis]NHC60014.1 hypothetical protein [Paenalcaligenes suwonensis]
MSGTSTPSNLKQLLIQHGFTSMKAEIWAKFVHHVVRVYWQAADQLLEPSNWTCFKQKLGALGKPKNSRAGTVTQVPLEDAITSEIGYLAEQIRIALPSDHFLRKHEVCFSYETLIPSSIRAGRHSKKVDFRVYSLYPDAPELAIEAKPVATLNDISSQYLGVRGMGCFFDLDSAYTAGPLGAMLAYNLTSDGSSMQSNVLDALYRYQPKPLHIHHSVSIPDCGLAHSSHHDRAAWNLQPITILHLERNFPVDVYQQT